jgi:Protein of unknown function (DUF2505)
MAGRARNGLRTLVSRPVNERFARTTFSTILAAPVRFEIVHKFDIPLDAVELAVLSPALIETLAPRLPNIETVQQLSHSMRGGVFERVWSYRANVKIPGFARPYVTPEMLGWNEESSYDLESHFANWSIVPHVKPAWRKFFSSRGTYRLMRTRDGSRRVIEGELSLEVPVAKQVAERAILREVRKAFDAEASALHDLATLV